MKEILQQPLPSKQVLMFGGEMIKKLTLVFALVVVGALGHPASAQQPKKVPRIGYLSSLHPARESTRAEAIRLALRELGYIVGYIEGQTSPSSTDMERGSKIGSLSLPPSWPVSRLISLW
jgi:hypothetical protein